MNLKQLSVLAFIVLCATNDSWAQLTLHELNTSCAGLEPKEVLPNWSKSHLSISCPLDYGETVYLWSRQSINTQPINFTEEYRETHPITVWSNRLRFTGGIQIADDGLYVCYCKRDDEQVYRRRNAGCVFVVGYPVFRSCESNSSDYNCVSKLQAVEVNSIVDLDVGLTFVQGGPSNRFQKIASFNLKQDSDDLCNCHVDSEIIQCHCASDKSVEVMTSGTHIITLQVHTSTPGNFTYIAEYQLKNPLTDSSDPNQKLTKAFQVIVTEASPRSVTPSSTISAAMLSKSSHHKASTSQVPHPTLSAVVYTSPSPSTAPEAGNSHETIDPLTVAAPVVLVLVVTMTTTCVVALICVTARKHTHRLMGVKSAVTSEIAKLKVAHEHVPYAVNINDNVIIRSDSYESIIEFVDLHVDDDGHNV